MRVIEVLLTLRKRLVGLVEGSGSVKFCQSRQLIWELLFP